MRTSLTNTQRAYYGAFVLSTVICWSPWKSIAYFAPALAVIWFIWRAHSRIARSKALKWIGAWIALITVYWTLLHGFDLAPALFAIVTYGTIGALYVIPSGGLGNPELLGRMFRFVALVVAIEATVGIAQAVDSALRLGFDSANGDVVQGTIYPAFQASRTFANPMFATNLAFMLICILPAAAQSKRFRGTVILGLISFVLASVMHVIILLVFSIGVGYMLCRPRLHLAKGRAFVIAGVCALPVLTYLFLVANVSSVRGIVRQALFSESPRAVVLLDSVTVLPREFPYMPYVGLGPGQFSSNAALIASGTYFRGGDQPVPFIHPQSSPAFSSFLADLVARARDSVYHGSITVEPFFSWLSVYTEFGLPCLIGIVVWLIYFVCRVRREAIRKNERLIGTAVITGVVFFALLGSQADYWELPQAIFLGGLIIKTMYAALVGKRQGQASEALRSGVVPEPKLA